MSHISFVSDPPVAVEAPSASRLVPPRVPPAPPSAASAGGGEEAPKLATCVLDMMRMAATPFSSIQEMLELLETVPGDNPLAPSLRDAIGSMADLAEGFCESIRHKLLCGGAILASTDVVEMKRETLRMCVRGISRRKLDAFACAIDTPGLAVFETVSRIQALQDNRLPDEDYLLLLPAGLTVVQMGMMNPVAVARSFLADLCRQLVRENALTSRHQFDALVVQRFVALEYATWRATSIPEGRPTLRGAASPRRDLDPEELRLRQIRDSSPPAR